MASGYPNSVDDLTLPVMDGAVSTATKSPGQPSRTAKSWFTDVRDAVRALQTVHRPNVNTSPLILGEAPFAGDPTGVVDSTAALVALRDQSIARGGELIFAKAGNYRINSLIDFTGAGGLIGSGAGKVSDTNGTLFTLTDDAAGFRLGADATGTVDSRSVPFGRFTIDANSLTGQAPAVNIGKIGGCDFDPVRVENHGGDIAVAIYRIQNSMFRRWTVANVQGNGYVLDKGCGGLHFVTCNHSHAGLSGEGVGVLVQETTGNGPYAGGPSDITWLQSIFERATSGQDAVVWLKDGYNLLFEHCNFATGGAAVEPVELVRLGGGAGTYGVSDVIFRDPTLSSNVTSDSIGFHTMTPGLGRVTLDGRVILKNLAKGIWLESTAEFDASPARISAPGTTLTWDGASATTRFPVPVSRTRRATNSSAYVGTGLANDSALAQTVEAGARYRVKMRLSYNPDSTTTKCKLGWQLPTGATFEWEPWGLDSASTSSPGPIQTARLTGSDVVTLGGDANSNVALPEGMLTTVDAGTFGPKFAEAVSGAGVVINTNTVLELERVG